MLLFIAGHWQFIAHPGHLQHLHATARQFAAHRLRTQAGEQGCAPGRFLGVAEPHQHCLALQLPGLAQVICHPLHIAQGLVVQPRASFLEAEVHTQPLRLQGQDAIARWHVALGGDRQGLDLLRNETLLGDDRLAGRALGKIDQGLGLGLGVGRQVKVQAP
ncbi:hypothetical protein D3C80_1397280 [compost metagenome]